MLDQINQDTVNAIKALYQNAAIAKAATVTTSTGLTAYSLQAPSKNLYPVNTPIRNSLPRIPDIGTATNWRQVTGLTGSGFDSMGWVPEGQRAGAMSLVTASKSATYRTLGEEEAISYEAINAARGFEDIKATSVLRMLQKLMLKEENSIIGGNNSVALGTPVTPTVTNAGTGGTIAANTYNVYVVALTFEGYKNYSTLAGGIAQSKTVTGQDGNTFTLNGGSSKTSAAGSTTTSGSTSTISASTTAVSGACAYAWYVGASGSEKLEAVTTINSVKLTALAGTGQAFSSLTTGTDYSQNSSVAYDGLLYTAFNNSTSAYINTLATGTAGTGSTLTASGNGSISEIDTMFQTMWNNYQLSPTVLFVNSQELKNITAKVLTGSGAAPLARFNIDAMGQKPTLTAGQVVGYYFNPYATNGGVVIPVKLHPALPAGTLLAWADNLPVQYQSTNVPNVAEMRVRQDYYQIDFPQTTRQQMSGVYTEQVLAVYAPFAIGVINNIANG